jgi:L-threonylcarbamoyladenylate synthase
MTNIGTDIKIATTLLEKGEVIGLPTETVYGLAGNALREDSVLKIFTTKNRPAFDPLICHTNSIEKVQQWVQPIPKKILELASYFWPGPLTLLLKKKTVIPDLTTSGLDTVAFRIPNHPIALELLSNLAFPVAAPSANPFGYVSPTSADHVYKQLGAKIPYILDGGSCAVGIESTIVGFEADQPIVYRLGGIPIELLESILGSVTIQLNQSSNPLAPGMLKSHYSPSKKVMIGNIDRLIKQNIGKRFGILSFDKDYTTRSNYALQLSKGSDMNEAARNLFGHLRTMDDYPIEVILTELVPDDGLGRAINDRLIRSATQD